MLLKREQREKSSNASSVTDADQTYKNSLLIYRSIKLVIIRKEIIIWSKCVTVWKSRSSR